MNSLAQEFVDSCPVENGFRMRGLEMTRLEVFIDAAFAFAVTMLVISFDSIPRSVFISTALLIVVLIYVYPMRIMAGGMFAWFTNDYLPSNFKSITLDQLRDMFIFLGLGFIALCLVFVEMYRYAARLKVELLLSEHELFESRTRAVMWTGAASIGLISVILAITLPRQLVPYSGFAFMLLAQQVRTRPVKVIRKKGPGRESAARLA